MDYEDLGFKCGIEIHQQLDTDTKLFCECSTEANIDSAAAKTKRFLRPVVSELGDEDRAAQFEYLKNKDFVYNIYPEVSCLVEMDEEPPHPIKDECMDTALEIALMLNCDIPDEIQWMRKTVIDGSNTSGFQRTSIIGLNGSLETSEGEVKIEDLELEEESAGIHGRKSEEAVYDLDRLGIPLIEIGTDSSIKSPKHAKEVALKIGMILRSMGKVKRGIGTIRQDVNVSIEGGSRVEIKGFQAVKNIDELIKKEVRRQKSLIQIKKELGEDEINIGGLEKVTGIMEESDNGLIKQLLKEGREFFALKTTNLSGYMKEKLCEGKTLGRELADYAQSHGVGGILHSDEAEGKDLEDEFNRIGEELDKEENDLVILIAGEEEKSKTALQKVRERIEILPERIPEETRDANSDFTTSYSRPLPGKARMYPETDVPPQRIKENRLERLRKELPETLEEKKKRIKDKIGEELADQVVGSVYFGLYEKFTEEFDLEDKIIANLFVNVVPDLKTREGLDTSKLGKRHFKELLQALENEAINKDAIKPILKFFIENPRQGIKKAISKLGIEEVKADKIREKIKEAIKEREDMVKEEGIHSKKALMGVLMKELKGKVSGSELNEMLEEEIEKFIED